MTRNRLAVIGAALLLAGCQSSRDKAVSICREFYGDDAVGEATVLDLPISDVEFVRKYTPGETSAAILLDLKSDADGRALGVRKVIFAASPRALKPECDFRTRNGDLRADAESDQRQLSTARALTQAMDAGPSPRWPPCCIVPPP